jgi:hypothetical protein
VRNVTSVANWVVADLRTLEVVVKVVPERMDQVDCVARAFGIGVSREEHKRDIANVGSRQCLPNVFDLLWGTVAILDEKCWQVGWWMFTWDASRVRLNDGFLRQTKVHTIPNTEASSMERSATKATIEYHGNRANPQEYIQRKGSIATAQPTMVHPYI